MIKEFSIKKICKYTIILVVVFLFYLFPKEQQYTLDKSVYNEVNANFHDIFLMDKKGYVSKTKIEVSSLKKDNLIDELIEILKKDGKYQDKIPNGFTSILPSDTKLLDKKIESDTLILNFNKELLDISIEYEEKELEALIYTLTSIKGINNIEINIDNKPLEKLPKTGKILDKKLNRDFGINKVYNIINLKDVSKIIVYYVSKTNNNETYYVPVTKYMNSNQDKIKIIIDELTSKISYDSNLMSYLNYNAKLLDYSFNENELDLNFNEYLFDNDKNKKVLEEVLYSISYSVEDNLNVSKINFYVNNQEIK